jgi:hypothetical protein
MRWQVVEDNREPSELERYGQALQRNRELRNIFYSLASKRERELHVWVDFTDISGIARWLEIDPNGDRLQLVRNLTHNVQIENIHLAGTLTRIRAFRSATTFMAYVGGIVLINLAAENFISSHTVNGVIILVSLVATAGMAVWFARETTIKYPELFLKGESND